jgi:hypothetical protein
MSEGDVFIVALQKEDPARRRAYLGGVCASGERWAAACDVFRRAAGFSPGEARPRPSKAAGGVLTAKQAPHRPGTAPALGLRAGRDVSSVYRRPKEIS